MYHSNLDAARLFSLKSWTIFTFLLLYRCFWTEHCRKTQKMLTLPCSTPFRLLREVSWPCDFMWHHVACMELIWLTWAPLTYMWAHVTDVSSCDWHVSSCDWHVSSSDWLELMWFACDLHVTSCDLHVIACELMWHHVTVILTPSCRSLWCGARQLPYKESSTRTATRVSRPFEAFCHPLSHPWIPEVAWLTLEASLPAQWSESRLNM